MNSELYHHGVLGQKWGIRRYQPYPKGERVKGGKEVGEATKVKQRDGPSSTVARSVKAANRKVEEAVKPKEKAEEKTNAEKKSLEPVSQKKANVMSEEELRSAVSRLQLEKQYTDLMKQLYPAPQPKASKGKSIVKKLAGEIAYESIKKVGTQTATYLLGDLVNKSMNKAGFKGIPVNVYDNKKPGDVSAKDLGAKEKKKDNKSSESFSRDGSIKPKVDVQQLINYYQDDNKKSKQIKRQLERAKKWMG